MLFWYCSVLVRLQCSILFISYLLYSGFLIQNLCCKAIESNILSMFSSIDVFYASHFPLLLNLLHIFFHLPTQVYDVTQYLDDHPGGDDVILDATGNTVYIFLPYGLLY